MNVHSLVRCTLINFLFLTLNPALADSASNEAYLKLSDEMRKIVDGNLKNFDSMRSIHGVIKTITTYPYPSSNGKEYRVMEETDEFWYDGNHSRTDTLEGKFIGIETDPLRLLHEETGGTLIIKPKAAGHTEIESIESSIYYEVTYPTVFVEPSTEKAGRFYKKIRFMHYQTIRGDTLKEEVLYLAERDQYFTVKNETLDGYECLLLEHYNADNDLTRKIWIVPSKGYCIKKLQLIQMGKLRYGYETTLKEYLPGIWGLDSAKVIKWGEPGKKIELSVKSLTLNEPIDPKTFTLAGTNIPIGTRIRDDISGLRYVYGTGYKLTQQDVDLALDAIENSMERPIKEKTDLVDKPSQKEPSKSRASTEYVKKNDPNVARNAHAEKTGRGFLLSVGLGTGLAVSVIALLLIMIGKKWGK